MRKFFLILLTASGICGSALAQSRNNVEFGVNVGYNEAYVNQGNSYYNSDYVSGFNVGVSADVMFSNHWSLKIKAIYDQKGWGNGYLVDAQGNETDGINFKLNYITVPIMANWHFGRTRNWYLNFGPYVGFLTSASEDAYGTDVKDAFNSTDFGLALGIGVKIPVSNVAKLFFELDGQGGVTNLLKDSGGNSIQSERSSVNVGISFPLK